MFGDIFFRNSSLPAVMKSLDAAMLRQRAIANNIANVNTPGYRRVEVAFEGELQKALDRTRLKGDKTDDDHLPIGRKDVAHVHPKAWRPVDWSLPSGVNNVDIDTEMAKLAENQIMFNYGARFVKGAYRKLNAAIQARSIPDQ
ncbi:MAG: flagellar basal body rod protein FlgB [Chitinivibrionales bacterium]|nr:flagellar basal body rod protein FlgB [Chitinivibrionales bacterium]